MLVMHYTCRSKRGRRREGGEREERGKREGGEGKEEVGGRRRRER